MDSTLRRLDGMPTLLLCPRANKHHATLPAHHVGRVVHLLYTSEMNEVEELQKAECMVWNMSSTGRSLW